MWTWNQSPELLSLSHPRIRPLRHQSPEMQQLVSGSMQQSLGTPVSTKKSPGEHNTEPSSRSRS